MRTKYSLALFTLLSGVHMLHAGMVDDFIAKHKSDDDDGHVLNYLAESKAGYAAPVLAGLQGADAEMRLRDDFAAINTLGATKRGAFKKYNEQHKSMPRLLQSAGTEALEAAVPLAAVTLGGNDNRTLYQKQERVWVWAPELRQNAYDINPDYVPKPPLFLCGLGFKAMYAVLAAQGLDLVHRLATSGKPLSVKEQKLLTAYNAQLSDSEREEVRRLQKRLRTGAGVVAALRGLQAAGTAAAFGVGKMKNRDGSLFATMGVAGLLGIAHKISSIYSRWRIRRAMKTMLANAHSWQKENASHSGENE